MFMIRDRERHWEVYRHRGKGKGRPERKKWKTQGHRNSTLQGYRNLRWSHRAWPTRPFLNRCLVRDSDLYTSLFSLPISSKYLSLPYLIYYFALAHIGFNPPLFFLQPFLPVPFPLLVWDSYRTCFDIVSFESWWIHDAHISHYTKRCTAIRLELMYSVRGIFACACHRDYVDANLPLDVTVLTYLETNRMLRSRCHVTPALPTNHDHDYASTPRSGVVACSRFDAG